LHRAAILVLRDTTLLQAARQVNAVVSPQDEPVPKPVDYWTLVEPIWLPLNRSWDDGPEKFVRRFRRVRHEAGHLYAAHWCQSEVRNGGFHQFFSNTSGLLAPEALEGFRAIGMIDWAVTLAEAMKHFGTPYPRDRDSREEFLPMRQRRPREEWDPFYELDQRFYESTDDWENAANTYAGRAVAEGGA
jgi:hypothetical protein